MWKNLEQIRKQVEDGAKEFAKTAIDGVRDLKAQQDNQEEDDDMYVMLER